VLFFNCKQGADFQLADLNPQIFSKKSHTLDLYHDAFQRISHFLAQKSQMKPDFSKARLSGKVISIFRMILWNIGLKSLVEWLWKTFEWRYYQSRAQNITIRSIFGIVGFGLLESQKVDELYQLLADDESRMVLHWFLQFKLAYLVVGPGAAEIFPRVNLGPARNRKLLRKKLGGLYQIRGFTIRYWNDWNEVEAIWLDEQYLLTGKCEPENGDVAIDAGGFEGETAIWLADKVGVKGKVYSFEPIPRNFRRLCENIDRNHLKNTIQPIHQGLWDKNTQINITDNGSCSTCLSEHGDMEIPVVTLDAFVENESIPRVDFIKMDLEGAEYHALRGAAQTIKRWKPKLAVCVYHLPEDIYQIPVFIKSLVPEYRLYLSHKSKTWHETVLFAVAE
jgi:FkbM family methyltransferase